jgi:uncharacterized protein (DUF1697 family)
MPQDPWYDKRRTGRYHPSEGCVGRLIKRALVRMVAFIALLRGINVGSNRKLPMADLRDVCLGLGFRQPETYIQSGNLVADTDVGTDEVSEQLQAVLTQRFGFTVDVVVRDAQAWAAYIAANPFTDGPAKMVHLCLSQAPINPTAAEALSERAKSGERLALAGGALWIDYGSSGVARSKLTPSLIDRLCGSPTTGRNWTTVLKLQDMLAARGRSITREPIRKRS